MKKILLKKLIILLKSLKINFYQLISKEDCQKELCVEYMHLLFILKY
jgi:hypothetical protein